MAHTVPPRSGLSTASWLLYLGVAAFAALALFTGQSIWRAFEERAGQARAAAIFDLVATRTASRPTDAPGAMAWLRRNVDRGTQSGADTSLADPSDATPPSLIPLAAALDRQTAASPPGALHFVYDDPVDETASVRRQRFVHAGSHTLVLTRRRALELGAEPDRERFVRAAGERIVAADAEVRAVLARESAVAAQSTLGGRPGRVVRIYAVHEDGALLSLPWTGAANTAASNDATAREMVLLSARPSLPAFAPDDFFFRPTERAYSGFYLDLGGRGLVSTLTAPFALTDGTRAVMAMDLAFDVDWPRMAASLEPPIAGAAVTLPADVAPSWTAFAAELRTAGSAGLRQASEIAAARSRAAGTPESAAPLRHAVTDSGAIAAFQVSDRTWLLAWFPQVAPSFPLAAVAMLSVLLALLLAGFEVNRRRAHGGRRAAERALQEKQNLLNTMQVPLVVVDPNTDAIVSANRAANSIGVRAGRRFADIVWPDARARAHYERMQVASPEPRRAYGVPVAVPGPDGRPVRKYAVVRSVAVTAPIEALDADERHRLGVLIVLDEASDLALLLEEVQGQAHQDERRRLAGLLSHGVDSLARVLEYTLSRRHDPEFAKWLAEYVERRISVTSWLLDHWDSPPPAAHESAIDASQARATIDRFGKVLALAAADRELRQRLHWDNGTLSIVAPQPIAVSIDWPDDVVVTSPVQGGFGLFLNELVANAVRHGAPGTTPHLTITCDRTRSELTGEVSNVMRSPGEPTIRAGDYGGVSILQAMSRLFGWPGLKFVETAQDSSATFTASWVMPFGTRRGGRAD